MADDPHEVLGVARSASPQQVAEAYRALAQIYHPDRYSDAPPRVQEEAQRRMQALNGAYAALGKPSMRQAGPPAAAPRSKPRPNARPEPPTRPRKPPSATKPPRPPNQQMQAVLYVDSSKHYHDAAVAPLGLDLRADPVRSMSAGRQCARLDGELSRWFQRQSRNASMADKLMYAAWDEQQRALYTATVGCSEVLRSSVEAFAAPCPECCPSAPSA